LFVRWRFRLGAQRLHQIAGLEAGLGQVLEHAIGAELRAGLQVLMRAETKSTHVLQRTARLRLLRAHCVAQRLQRVQAQGAPHQGAGEGADAIPAIELIWVQTEEVAGELLEAFEIEARLKLSDQLVGVHLVDAPARSLDRPQELKPSAPVMPGRRAVATHKGMGLDMRWASSRGWPPKATDNGERSAV